MCEMGASGLPFPLFLYIQAVGQGIPLLDSQTRAKENCRQSTFCCLIVWGRVNLEKRGNNLIYRSFASGEVQSGPDSLQYEGWHGLSLATGSYNAELYCGAEENYAEKRETDLSSDFTGR